MSFSRSLMEKNKKVWEDCYHHPFVQELGRGTLDKEIFKFYLVQDYKYLIEYARVYALGAVKAKSETLMTNFTVSQHSILYHEMDNHRAYMKSFGIEDLSIDDVEASLFNKAYTANMLAVGQTGVAAEIIATIFPCGWTYYDFGVRLKEDFKDQLDDNFYKSWIEMYASPEFLETFEWFFDALDDLCANMTASELKEIENLFKVSVEFEYLFWDMAYHKKMSY